MTPRLRVIVAGLIAQHPVLGGMTWHYLQYVLGLMRLGHDAYYVEDSGEWPYNLHGGPSGVDFQSHDCTENVRYLSKVMSQFGLGDRWAYRCPIDGQWFGLNGVALRTRADLLLNVSGTLARPEEYRQIGTLGYIDTDPVFTQINLAQGEANLRRKVDAHDVHFSFGECLGGAVPATGHEWHPTRQPVVLSEWRPSANHRDVFTTVMNWASYDCVVYDGRTYGQKDVEFVHFLELPAKVAGCVFEISVRGTRKGRLPGAGTEREPGDLIRHLTENEWHVVDSTKACPDSESYRRYIESSKAEWSVAKNAYVAGRCGWFSDRSACYLAAGRPVVVQDTGFGAVLPVGEGILSFANMDEAVAAIREVEADYERHRAAAREIAEEYFDSGKVLSGLVQRAMNTRSHPISEGVRQ